MSDCSTAGWDALLAEILDTPIPFIRWLSEKGNLEAQAGYPRDARLCPVAIFVQEHTPLATCAVYPDETVVYTTGSAATNPLGLHPIRLARKEHPAWLRAFIAHTDYPWRDGALTVRECLNFAAMAVVQQ